MCACARPQGLCRARAVSVTSDPHAAVCEHGAALESYMEAAALSSNHFQLAVPQGVWSQMTLRRLIKSCCKLGYVTQAVVLCQLLQPVDYEMAFAILKEHGSDTVDSVFPYFWDMTIIEYLIRILIATPTRQYHLCPQNLPGNNSSGRFQDLFP